MQGTSGSPSASWQPSASGPHASQAAQAQADAPISISISSEVYSYLSYTFGTYTQSSNSNITDSTPGFDDILWEESIREAWTRLQEYSLADEENAILARQRQDG